MQGLFAVLLHQHLHVNRIPGQLMCTKHLEHWSTRSLVESSHSLSRSYGYYFHFAKEAAQVPITDIDKLT